MGDVVGLPVLLTEKTAAARIGVSLTTLQRHRRAGAIECTKIGRCVKYTEQQILDYLESCKCREKPAPLNSENISSANGAIRRTGADAGLIPSRDRQNAKVLALKTLRKQQSSSKAGSSNTENNHTGRASKSR